MELEGDEAEHLIEGLVGRTILGIGFDEEEGEIYFELDDGRDMIIYTPDEDAGLSLMVVNRDVRPPQ